MRRTTLAAFAAPSIGLAALNLPLLIFIPAYYNQALGLPLALIGSCLLLVRLLDIGFDPLAGMLMDQTTGRHGRYKPWLGCGALVLAAATFALFMPPAGMGARYLVISLLLVYAGHSMCYLALLSWGAALSPDYLERCHIFTWWQAANMIGVLLSVSIPLFAPAAYAHLGDTLATLAAGISAALLLSVGAALRWVPSQHAASRSGRLPVTTYLSLLIRPNIGRLLLTDLLLGMAVLTHGPLYFFYFQRVKGLELPTVGILLLLTNAGALLGTAIWGNVASRLGKHRAALLAFLIYALGLPLVDWLPTAPLWPFALYMLLHGTTLSAAPQLLRAMMADAGDEERLRAGLDHTALLSALFAASNKLGGALGPGLALMALGWSGFDGGQPHSTDAQLQRLSELMIWAPAALGLVGAVVISGYPLTAVAHARIREALKAQDEDAQACFEAPATKS